MIEEELQELRQAVRRQIIHSVADTLRHLIAALPAGRPKHNQLLLLLSRAEEIRGWRIGNTRSQEQISIAENELREDVLLFTDHLSLRDFAEAPPVRPELRPGHLLYRVPSAMQLRQQHECLVRIAHTLAQVMEGLEQDERVEVESVPVAEVMQVEIIDPSPPDARAFDILLVSDGEQLVDEYSYTEWVFYARPLRSGIHNLVLKVSVLVTVKGKERTKNLVFRRQIDVRTEAVAAAPALRQVIAVAAPASEVADATLPPPISPRLPTRGGESKAEEPRAPYVPYAQPAPAPPESRPARSSPRRWLSVAAGILVIAVAGWWVVNTGGGETTTPVILNPDEPVEMRNPDLDYPIDSLLTDPDSLRE